MASCNIEVDIYTCNFALKVCMGLGDYDMGMEVIQKAVDRGMERDRFLGSSMISFLVKFDNVVEAKGVFDRMR